MILSLILSGLLTHSMIQNTPMANSPLFTYLNKTVSEIYRKLPEQRKTNQSSIAVDVYDYLDSIGYLYKTHHVTTEDGYILCMQRITGSPYGASTNWKSKPVVLLMHGMEGTSMDWLFKGPNSSLPLRLADEGWDVWLGNNRGNSYSRNHTSLDPDADVEFWDFSFDECGNYDLRSFIDQIESVTGNKRIFYVGHSQGTTQYFALTASRPEYNDKIVLMTALAPIVYMSNVNSPIMRLACNNLDLLQVISAALNIHEFKARDPNTVTQLIDYCDDNPDICFFILSVGTGFNRAQNDKSILPNYLSHFPSGYSIKMLYHYGQEINSGYFRRYDYGLSGNLDRYKTPFPTSFNLSAVTSPVALYYSKNDILSSYTDVERLVGILPNIVKKSLNKDMFFTHMNYMDAKDVNKLLYDEVIAHMASYVSDEDGGNNAAKHLTVNVLTITAIVVGAISFVI